MAKQKSLRKYQVSPRSTVALCGFWTILAQMLTAERELRNWSYVAVEKAGGPSYGIVQEHERGRFKSVRAMLLHLHAFEWNYVDTIERVLVAMKTTRHSDRMVLEVHELSHIRYLRAVGPTLNGPVFSLAKEMALEYGGAKPEQAGVTPLEFAAAPHGNPREKLARRK